MTDSIYSIRLDQSLVSTFSELSMSAFIVDDIVPDRVKSWLNGASDVGVGAFLDDLPAFTSETLSQVPLVSMWREAYRQQGLKPSQYRSSPEALAKSALNGRDLTTPIHLVNLYNQFSLGYLSPLGGYDTARLSGTDIVLRKAAPDTDHFKPLGGQASKMPLTPDIAVYADGDEVICWAFNHRDSAKTCLKEDTTNAIFCTESIRREHHHSSIGALNALRDTLSKIECSVGTIATVNADTQSAPLPSPSQ